MARSLVFLDSFDHYDNLNLKWDDNGGTGSEIDLSGTRARTGIGCCLIGGAFGPVLSVTPISGPGTALMMCTAFYQPQLQDSTGSGVLSFHSVSFTSSATLFRVGVNANLGLTCVDIFGAPFPGGTSAPNIVVANAYNIIEAKVFFVASGGGSAIIRCNGATVLTLTGISTLLPTSSFVACTFVQLGGPGGLGGGVHDDFTLWTSTSQTDDDFPGGVKIYAVVPSANGALDQWTPLSGTNWSEVNEIPPNGDTSYNSSAVPGNTDLYVFNPTLAGVPSGLIVLALQHSLCTRVDAGTASVASVVGADAAAGVAVGGSYHFVPIQPYDTNPVAGRGWLLTDFPATQLGPKQTA